MVRGRRALHALPRRPKLVRYGVAVVAVVAALVCMEIVKGAVDVPAYSLLVGAVAVAVWYGGLGCGAVAVAVGWAGAIPLMVADRDALGMTASEAWVDWGLALGVAAAVVWIAVVLRRGRFQAAEAADVAEESLEGVEALQALSSALSAAASVSEVVSTLVEGAPLVVGAPVALGSVEEGEILIAQPQGVTLAPWQALRLTEGRMLHRTATEGTPLRAIGRDAFEEIFPETAALAPGAEAAIAVPLRVEGRVIGSIGFVFDRADDVHDDAETLAVLVAGVGGQALERARLYEREQESRRGLDRILRVAPRFFSGSEPMVTEAICREARQLLGADLAMLWQVEGSRLRLVSFTPALEPLETGLEAELAEFPWLQEAVDGLSVSFVPDVSQEARGAGRARVERLGLRSSLRVPVVIGGEAELILILSWRALVPEPDRSSLVLVRRFADHAGLALEQLARRLAQEEATRRALEARRLQEMTAALANAATPADVAAVLVEHARSAVGADAGFVVALSADGDAAEIVASEGHTEEEIAAWGSFSLADDVPVSRAVAMRGPVWALTSEAMRGLTGVGERRDRGWAALTLQTSAGTHGALQLTWRGTPAVSDDARERLGTIVAQCGLALERSLLLDSERRLRRRSERLQAMTAELSNALTRADVADVLLAHVDDAVGLDGAVVAVLERDLRPSELLGTRGDDDHVAARLLELPSGAETPLGRALRRLAPYVHPVEDEARQASGAGTPVERLFVPLVLGRRPVAVMIASSREPFRLEPGDLEFLGSLAGQAAQALERARQFDVEQAIAETLQQSVLPATLPEVPGVELAGRYLAGTSGLEVGGDWYDAIPLASGRIALVVGDVVGKGVRAAATMGQLRNAIRAFSLDRLKPSSTLARLSHLSEEVVGTSFTTVVYAEIDPSTRVCRYASAGHPPVLVASLDGSIGYLEGGRGLPLGTGMPPSYRQDTVELSAGSVLVFFTDGLIERRGASLDEGLERLRAAVAEGPRDPARLVEHVLGRLIETRERSDDVVVLAARLLPVAPAPLELRLAGDSALRHSRDALRTWLAGAAVDALDEHDIVLAAWEACANAAEHSGAPPGAAWRLRVELDGDLVRVVVEDDGRWRPPLGRTERGHGLRLMHSLMSSVTIARGETGTRVTLERKLAARVPPVEV